MIEVVIPAHNAAPYLHETLASVAAQTRRPDLVSVVDDASADATIAIAEAAIGEFADRIRIRLLRNEGPRGPSAARNTAIRRSEADFIALVDADDPMLPDHLAILARPLETDPRLVASFGDSEVFADTGVRFPSLLAKSGVVALPAIEGPTGYWQLRDGIFPPLLRSGVFGTSASLFRRDAATAAGLFDEAMMHGEDTDLFLRLSFAGGFAFSHAVISRKREHASNLTHGRNALAFRRAACRSLMKLAAPPWEEKLDAARRAALRAALPQAVDAYLYHASRASWSAYRQASEMARAAGLAALARKPKHLARLVAFSLRR